MLNAIDVFRGIESLPFARHSSELFDRPSINLGRIWGGDALNKVPDRCVIDVDIRYLPDQDPDAILAEVRALPGIAATPLLTRPPATVDRDSPFVRGLRESAAAHHHGEPMSVGRDGASDAVSFLRVGVPAVEFGPVGAGHHGPAEWVSVSSLEAYRQALDSFLRAIPGRLDECSRCRLAAGLPKKPPPQGDGTEAPPKRSATGALHPGLDPDRRRLRRGDRDRGPALPRQHRRRALAATTSTATKLEEATSRRSTAASRRTILILGSDKRAGAESSKIRAARTRRCCCASTPTSNAIAVMSIPRDLKVEIPGYGTGKFNDAYSYGGPKLTLQTVKELTGLPINHVVNVDFLGFVRAVYAIGCVYVDVDRRYYHSNAGLPASEQYAEINIQPGYQQLCGKKALQYVRYRHTDTDLVRSARQQDFLSQARQQVSAAGPGLRPEQPDRHLHRIHDLRHQRQGNDAAGAETASSTPAAPRSTRSTSRPNSGRASSTRPRKRSTARSTIFLGIEASGDARGSLERRRRRRQEEEGRQEGQEEEAARSRRSRTSPKPKPPGQRWPGASARSRRSRGRGRGPPGRRAASRCSTRRRLPVRRLLRGKNRYEHISGSAHLPPQRQRRGAPCRLPDGRWSWSSTTGPSTSGSRGSAAGQTRRSSTTRA